MNQFQCNVYGHKTSSLPMHLIKQFLCVFAFFREDPFSFLRSQNGMKFSDRSGIPNRHILSVEKNIFSLAISIDQERNNRQQAKQSRCEHSLNIIMRISLLVVLTRHTAGVFYLFNEVHPKFAIDVSIYPTFYALPANIIEWYQN